MVGAVGLGDLDADLVEGVELCGSWKTIAAFVLRISWKVVCGAPTSSVPSSLMLPVIFVRFMLCRPRTAMLETDLPEPDSPTMARVRPRRAS